MQESLLPSWLEYWWRRQKDYQSRRALYPLAIQTLLSSWEWRFSWWFSCSRRQIPTSSAQELQLTCTSFIICRDLKELGQVSAFEKGECGYIYLRTIHTRIVINTADRNSKYLFHSSREWCTSRISICFPFVIDPVFLKYEVHSKCRQWD